MNVVDPTSVGTSLADRAAVAATVAALHADDVDRAARFPREAMSTLKAARLLGAMVPIELGGEGATMTDIAEICSRLGQACASTAMIFAMHQIQVRSLLLRSVEDTWQRGFLSRIATEQLLLASATSEAGVGGDLRTSLCAVERDGDRYRLEKCASVISYGAHADAILATARREASSPPSDQVLVVVTSDERVLERTSAWDTMGMRGTCSEGFLLKASGPADHIVPAPFAEIASCSMLATSHLLWASLWCGIAFDAVRKAQSFVRAEARRQPTETPPGARRLAAAAAQLQVMKATVRDGLRRFDDARDDTDDLTSMGFAVAMNAIKVASSRMAAEIVAEAMLVCGIAGFRNDTPYSLGRAYRDILSAQLMINNDRIFGSVSKMLLVHRLDETLVA